ncbi:hypothetical protein [Halarchaeum nitratireducens]|uniref:Uncharacterized protein n=1 Tax=Halarchaeum nitratireducens TaxID=489913 RepID=A0A830GBK3_9EURY|nr:MULTISPECIES: hypothetical protein [Halarchaeum]MBP2251149.1 Arc/MetJ-type ribon-helix-helix transcriptional regulator [Halarchaeum solikamskense]GGN18665.1 hypothetical protein GCM10009021_19660 [Halarchaeum nitratireducens]
MTDARARLSGELAEWYEERENGSETVRDALRLLMAREEAREFEGLSDDQEVAESWLLENVGIGNNTTLSWVENRLAQQLSLDMEQIRMQVTKPLNQQGYISVKPRRESVDVVVQPPTAGESVSASREGVGEASSGRDGGGLSEAEAEVLSEARERLADAEPARADGGGSA